MRAPEHPAEDLRLDALHRLEVLDTAPEQEFDDIVDVAAAFCEAPISMVSLVDADRQWFKSAVGINLRETPREHSICAHAILHPELLEIQDLLEDPRFTDNPMVAGEPHFRFYAGAVLQSDDGLPLGTICVLDHKPRMLTDAQRKLLRVVARQVTARLDLRRALKIERGVTTSLANTLLEQQYLLSQNQVLRQEVDHRVKNSLQMVASFLAMQCRRSFDPAVRTQLAEALGRVVAIASVHDQLHRSAQADRIPVKTFLHGLCAKLAETRPLHVEAVEVTSDDDLLNADQVMALGLAASELVSNAFKHAYSETRRGEVAVSFAIDEGIGTLTVSDRGPGLPESFRCDGGAGLGMRVLSALAARLAGCLSHESGPQGTSFRIRFPITSRPV